MLEKVSTVETKVNEMQLKMTNDLKLVHQSIENENSKETSKNNPMLEKITGVETKISEIQLKMNNDLKQVHRSESEKENFKETRNNKTGGSLNHNENETSKNRNSQDEMKYHVHIIGSSIVKGLVPNRIYRNTRVTTLNDKTIEGAIEFANRGKLKENILFTKLAQTNQMRKKPDEVLEEIEALIDATNNVLKNTSITIERKFLASIITVN
ncbi:unnamed protein product [Mytilus edulis]|uniref:Uncharacterized protein n=1 Tax=Mytilus edulis TaxID=6550 RepID=A0A8S3Q2N6_MYTED|nr:unnamed protein product [Mytilus edulis]